MKTSGIFHSAKNAVLLQKEGARKKLLLKSGTGGLTVATKIICDRCGAEISPKSYVTYAGMRLLKTGANDNDYELCVSCAHKLSAWLSGKENDNG